MIIDHGSKAVISSIAISDGNSYSSTDFPDPAQNTRVSRRSIAVEERN